MSGEMEWGTCPQCKKEGPINRTYYRYVIKCECHSPNHFEIVYHCNDCEPIEPTTTKVEMKTENLVKFTMPY
jgi:hypothetical protein